MLRHLTKPLILEKSIIYLFDFDDLSRLFLFCPDFIGWFEPYYLCKVCFDKSVTCIANKHFLENFHLCVNPFMHKVEKWPNIL